MNSPNPVNASPNGAINRLVSDLLRCTYGLLADCLDSGDTAVSAALLTTVEAALGLAEVREELIVDPAARRERVREAYLCTRAAATTARFAVFVADDLHRISRQGEIDAAEPGTNGEKAAAAAITAAAVAAASIGAHHADR